MTITPQQKKTAGAIAALTIVYYAPSIASVAMRLAQQQNSRQPSMAFAKTSQAAAAPIAAAQPFRPYVGTYAGRAQLDGRALLCAMKFELRPKPQASPGTFAGFATLNCMPLAPLTRRPPAATGPRTASAILSGVAENGAIRFQADDVTGAIEGCIPTGFTLKPFGLRQILVEWRDCKPAAMILSRAGR
ncbi:MAG TPA: hypothetical protein VME43_08685 [Bryobacteraceae bacterium]|nr:hypothetical protein [Bryobacteraceae bacterium]